MSPPCHMYTCRLIFKSLVEILQLYYPFPFLGTRSKGSSQHDKAEGGLWDTVQTTPGNLLRL